MGPKTPNTLRVVVQNISGFPMSHTHIKNRQILGFLNQHQVDVCAMSEMNTCWHLLPIPQRLHERTIGWWETLNISYGYNRHSRSTSAYQKGGVAILSINSAAHRVMASGHDPSGLGRWTWTKLRGRNNVVLRVVSAYRPVLNTLGALAVYNQHRQILYDNNDDRCPRTAILEDLCSEVVQWLEDGEQIILGIDMNDNITNPTAIKPFLDAGLEEVVTGRHGSNAPSTYNRGLTPIDGIFVSRTLRDMQCGYLAFGEGIPSDHRCLWIDVPYMIAFGHDVPPCVAPSARRLKCNDPRIVKRYLDHYETFLLKHHLLDRAFNLQAQATAPLTATDAAEWESIDSLRVSGMIQAEKHCRKLRHGAVAWSPQLQQAIDMVTAWQLVCRRRRGVKVNSRYLHRICNQAGLPSAANSTLQEAQAELSMAYTAYKRIKQGADANRQTWLEGLAVALEETGNTSASTHYRTLIEREKQRQAARQIKRVTGKLRSGGLLSVVAPQADGTWIELTSPHDIAQACLHENERRFHQANDTPFMVSPLSNDIGHLGVGSVANQILRGEYAPPPGTDPYAEKLIQHLRMEEDVASAPPMSTVITTEEHCRGWQRVRERTSSGPSGLHFGHFKAGATRRSVADFEATMANIPFATGYSPTRWQHGTDVELVKKPGNFKVTDLRTIILYDAEFNRNNAILGRRLMTKAELHSQLAPEQYGSRKGFNAIEHGLNKRLTFDLIRQLRIPAALCSNDAKSCYDRIVHSVATLSMRRLGIPVEPILSMFLTIQNMKHSVRTSYGDSANWFGGPEWKVPVHGVGQGNGAGPAIWAAVSTPVLNLMRSEGFGTRFTGAISGEQIQFVGYAFVDDTDLCETARDGNTSAELVATRMQEALNTWEGGIRATGGALVPAKSYWYLIDFTWKNGKWRYSLMNDTQAQLTVRDAQGRTGPLERLPAHEARRTLGVRLAPDGNNLAEYNYLRDQASTWGDQVRSGHLPRHLAWQALTTSLLPKLRYPLPATTFSRRACKNILAPALQAGLPASGIVRTMPRALVHAPLSSRGFNLPDLYTEQGIKYIEQLLAHGYCDHSITGKLLRGSIQQMKVELGLPGALLRQDYSKYHLLVTDTWIKHAWLFLWEHSMTIEEDGPHLQLRREGDQFIVAAFSAAGYKKTQLVRLNRCRLFLQVTTLADITIGLGTTISQSAWQGLRDTTRPTYYTWPQQQRPPQDHWIEWQAALTKTFGAHERSREILQPMGSWQDECSGWLWFFSEREERLYQRDNNQWYFYVRLPGRASRAAHRKYSKAAQPVIDSCLPADLQRATVDIAPAYIYCSGAAPANPQIITARAATFGLHILQQAAEVRWALRSVAATTDGAGIAAAIATGRCIGVSDGSYKEAFGTAAWVLVDQENDRQCLQGECIVPGESSDQSAFRSEVAGLFALSQLVRYICEYYDVTTGHVTIGCDGQEALHRVFDPVFQPTPHDAHFDLLIATRRAIASTSITWSYRWVKGHQDDDEDCELDQWARLNISMDQHAKNHWENHHNCSVNPQLTIYGEPWPLRIGTHKICHDLRHRVLDHTTGSAARKWWVEHTPMTAETASIIAWEAGSLALARAKRSRRHWVVKHSSGFCSVGHMMTRWHKWPSADCPRCCMPDETASHVWTCRGQDADRIWDSAIEKLRTWMVLQETAPEVSDAICFHLKAWRSGVPGEAATYHLLGLPAAVRRQTDIGWQGFLEGFIATDWEFVQNTYYSWAGSKKTGRRWASAIIQKLWDVAWDLWEHRNGFVHHESAENSISQQAMAAVRHEYTEGPGRLPSSDAHLFRQSLDTLLAAPTDVQRAWVALVQASRRRAQRRDAVAYRGERKAMWVWLTGNRGTGHERQRASRRVPT